MKLPFRQFHLFSFLRRFDDAHRPLDAALSDYLRAHRSIGAGDRRDICDSVYELIRWKGLLDHLLGKPASWEERHSLLQRIDTAALPQTLPLWARTGSSPWLFAELVRDFGEAKAAALSRALNQPAPVSIRANLLKTSRETLLKHFEREGAEPGAAAPHAILFPRRLPLTSFDAFKQGLFEIQDEGSQLVAELVAAEPSQQVLDYCSGSGGKALAIAPKLQGRGQIYLHDVRAGILKQARARLKRAGVQNGQFLPPGHPKLAQLKGKADWVLADVPCSGSGTLRRNPDMKWKIDGALVDRLALEQAQIFSAALEYAKGGGHIVYATCSLFKRENEEQVERFLARHPVELIGEPLSILPEPGGPDGFFAALFCKKN